MSLRLFRIGVVMLLLLSLALLTACGQNPKKELEKMKITFNEESFIKCVESGNIEAVKLFLDAGMNPDTEYDKNDKYPAGTTALAVAVVNKRTQIVDLLLSKGADTNVPDSIVLVESEKDSGVNL